MPPRAVIVIVALVVAMGVFFVLGAVTSPHLPDVSPREPSPSSSSVVSLPAPVLPGAPPPLPALPAGNPRDERWPAAPRAARLDDDPADAARGIRPGAADLDGLPRTLGDVVDDRAVLHDGERPKVPAPAATTATTATTPAPAETERTDAGP